MHGCYRPSQGLVWKMSHHKWKHLVRRSTRPTTKKWQLPLSLINATNVDDKETMSVKGLGLNAVIPHNPRSILSQLKWLHSIKSFCGGKMLGIWEDRPLITPSVWFWSPLAIWMGSTEYLANLYYILSNEFNTWYPLHINPKRPCRPA